ncbi:MAG: hypothetical protein HY700_01145 [Gemmatimonadetes bacterium]|nr:hypothetical protein [Gemmatimonadota bacterium]
MPVTAKLSRKFYDTLGDEIANELVEWFNSVDATYRSDLRELNELNFQRFDSKLEQRVAQLDTRIAQSEARLLAAMHDMKAELMKWMFGTIFAAWITLLGAMVALAKLR